MSPRIAMRSAPSTMRPGNGLVSEPCAVTARVSGAWTDSTLPRSDQSKGPGIAPGAFVVQAIAFRPLRSAPTAAGLEGVRDLVHRAQVRRRTLAGTRLTASTRLEAAAAATRLLLGLEQPPVLFLGLHLGDQFLDGHRRARGAVADFTRAFEHLCLELAIFLGHLDLGLDERHQQLGDALQLGHGGGRRILDHQPIQLGLEGTYRYS